jgi:AcrR family transcriptional regulator
MKSSEPSTTPKRSAGRPRAFDREEALAIALDLFWRQGFDCTSTTQLTAAMGISQPSLYAAFGSKEALYRETLSLYGQRYGAYMAQALTTQTSAQAAVRAFLLGAAKQFSDRRHALGCMVASSGLQGGPENAALYADIAALRQAAQAAIQVRLEAGKAAGELPADTDTAALAAFFAMVIQGMAVQARDGASKARLTSLVELALQAWPGAARA